MTAPTITTDDVDALLADTLGLAHATIHGAAAPGAGTGLAARLLALNEHMINGGPRPAAWAHL